METFAAQAIVHMPQVYECLGTDCKTYRVIASHSNTIEFIKALVKRRFGVECKDVLTEITFEKPKYCRRATRSELEKFLYEKSLGSGSNHTRQSGKLAEVEV